MSFLRVRENSLGGGDNRPGSMINARKTEELCGSLDKGGHQSSGGKKKDQRCKNGMLSYGEGK